MYTLLGLLPLWPLFTAGDTKVRPNIVFYRYQFHLIPGKQQSYQFLQIVTAMIVDLGLDLSPRQAMEQKIGIDISHHTGNDNEFYSMEAQRAYLGCYYLSILYSHWLMSL